uniref:Integrase core domain containing protein n=1 Tax=Solanum tuberosum TaxID=4113 RepID=M1DGJ5_SOLTU
MAHMRTQIDLLTRHIVAKSEKVNVVGQHTRYEDQDLDIDEEANYLGNQGGFWNYNSGNQGYNSGNAGRSYARDGQYERLANRDQGNWQNRDGYRNDRSGVYVPLGNRDRVSGNSTGSKLEDMMAKVLQKVESTDVGVKEMREAETGVREETVNREDEEEITDDDTMVMYVNAQEPNSALRPQLIACYRSMWTVNRCKEFFDNGIVNKTGGFKNRAIMPETRVVVADVKAFSDIYRIFQLHQFDWMDNAPGEYSSHLTREFYSS